ncbi:MAG: hypothetical protein ACRD04_14215 [Terriglobales bacterium]
MSLYADTGIFVALYLSDACSGAVQKLAAEFRPHFWMTPLVRAEWSHEVFQSISAHKLSASEARQVLAHFERDLERGRWREIAMPKAAVERSMALARAHGHLRPTTSDTLHVASALELRAIQFWTVSPQAAALAEAVKLAVVCPGLTEESVPPLSAPAGKAKRARR